MTRKRKKAEKPTSDDYGSDWRAQHMGGLEKEVRDRSGTGQPTSFGMRANAECVLDAYWNRTQINWKQYQSGLVVRRLYIQASMQPNVTGNYGDRILGNGDWVAACNDAKKALRKAVGSIPGRLRPVVYQVCCDDLSANHRDKGKRGLAVLRDALDCLSGYFQICDVEAA